MSTIQHTLRRHFFAVNLLFTGLLGMLAGYVVLGLLNRRLAAWPEREEVRLNPLRDPSAPGVGPAPLRASPRVIAKRDIFCSGCDARGKGGASPSRNPLTGRLLVTITPADPGGGLALIRMNMPGVPDRHGIHAGTTRGHRFILAEAGTRIGQAVVRRVESRRVELEERGKVRYLHLFGDEEPGPPLTPKPSNHPYGEDIRQTGPHAFELSGRLLSRFLAEGAIFARGVDIRPETASGQTTGYRLNRLAASHPLSAMGVRSGDVIRAVNNQAVTDWDRMLEMMTKLRGATHLSISLVRGGRPVTLDYSVRR